MIVHINNKSYRVSWDHDYLDYLEDKQTLCTIEESTDNCEWMPLITGVAYCSLKDHYCKETGRKIFMTKAIAKFPKEVRKLIWNAYRSRK